MNFNRLTVLPILDNSFFECIHAFISYILESNL